MRTWLQTITNVTPACARWVFQRRYCIFSNCTWHSCRLHAHWWILLLFAPAIPCLPGRASEAVQEKRRLGMRQQNIINCPSNQPKVHWIPDECQDPRSSASDVQLNYWQRGKKSSTCKSKKMSFIHVTKNSVEICRKNLQDILHHWTMQVPSQ